jgi:hypothetical protein
MISLRACSFVIALVLAAPFEVAAQDPPSSPTSFEVLARDSEGRTTIRAVRVMEPMRIDGALDEPPPWPHVR